MNILFPIIALIMFPNQKDFKKDQLRYPRVRVAYEDKEESMLKLLENQGIERSTLSVYLRAFKSEKEIELWGRDEASRSFKLIRTYEVCAISGKIGPKRKQGDLQIPEGFYHIDRFNPYSNYYLSLGINYPNNSDRILGTYSNLGGDIFIHGNCVTIGCLPITDEQIKELYIFCVEARSNDQEKIPVTIFPSRLEDAEFEKLKNTYANDKDKLGLWEDLKKGYDIFN
jgi:murein L,D-transpeptidase YafK